MSLEIFLTIYEHYTWKTSASPIYLLSFVREIAFIFFCRCSLWQRHYTSVLWDIYNICNIILCEIAVYNIYAHLNIILLLFSLRL